MIALNIPMKIVLKKIQKILLSANLDWSQIPFVMMSVIFLNSIMTEEIAV